MVQIDHLSGNVGEFDSCQGKYVAWENFPLLTSSSGLYQRSLSFVSAGLESPVFVYSVTLNILQ